MDWSKAVNENPDAFWKLVQWTFDEIKDNVSLYKAEGDENGDVLIKTNDGSGSYVYMRDLYDFFDEHGIFVSVKQTYPPEWGFEITKTGHNDSQLDRGYATRRIAEQQAFLKAFGILNTQI